MKKKPKKKSKSLCPPPTEPHQDLVMTPPALAYRIVMHFNPQGMLCDPCRGRGAFYKAMVGLPSSSVSWWEIQDGQDYLTGCPPFAAIDWIVTNPPWSRDLFNAFLAKSMKESDNVVFLVAMNKLMTRLRMEMIDKAEFGFKEILRVERPKSWPSSGFEYAAIHLQRGWTGDCKFSRLQKLSPIAERSSMPAKPKKFSLKVRRIARDAILGSAVKSSERWGTLLMDISDKELGQKLRQLRKDKRVKAKDVATRMGYGGTNEGVTICNMENGRARWSADKVLEYVDAVVELSA